ncbi:hypothetical protein, unlikely [Trypanosoma brucei gambiense DAL972]|uniref:Uncharacterized protein n=1 Tax=Trypanosoma brucei gambiense (strain MHOM/CI/86/DAL972) TaxID=679716 RepID=C9ZVY0_TRYB9|nr:hypothetical protein, unlikely [Trypanosoma brucei gambiense DAL972]CBH13568.1 hypothetical protein, unlikely [Trypanosoma brucei gambiense DAL972]|eukprot:XP_011775845.1 hypothetical protein, unlikely [Trypanosoma brucei gambiense DAL972]
MMPPFTPPPPIYQQRLLACSWFTFLKQFIPFPTSFFLVNIVIAPAHAPTGAEPYCVSFIFFFLQPVADGCHNFCICIYILKLLLFTCYIITSLIEHQAFWW